jgi:maleate isomerase
MAIDQIMTAGPDHLILGIALETFWGGVAAAAELQRELKFTTPRSIAQVPASVVRSALKDLDGHEVDAILQVGTALPTVAIAAEAERWLGKPVLAINTLTYWDALRRSGIADRVWGYGRILEEF